MEHGLEEKVPSVARALRDAMQAAGARAYLRPLLTSHAAVGELEAALALVQAAKEADLAEGPPSASEPALADGRANGGPGGAGLVCMKASFGLGSRDAPDVPKPFPAEASAGTVWRPG